MNRLGKCDLPVHIIWCRALHYTYDFTPSEGLEKKEKLYFHAVRVFGAVDARVPVIRNITNGKTNSHPRHMFPVSKPPSLHVGVIWCGRVVSLAGLTSNKFLVYLTKFNLNE